MSGARLIGHDFPPQGAWLSLTVAVPPRELSAVARVAWVDDARHAIGVELDGSSPRHKLGLAMLALASELETERPVIAVLADDPRLAALLCDGIRRRGYVPNLVRTPLDAILVLGRENPRIGLALIARRALGMTGDAVEAFIAHEFPRIARVAVDDDQQFPDELDLRFARLA